MRLKENHLEILEDEKQLVYSGDCIQHQYLEMRLYK